jgi:hypothetical protein
VGNGAYKIEVSIQPICPDCGAELIVGLTESKVTGHPFERDNPYARKDRRVFIYPCDRCFIRKSEVAALTAEPPAQQHCEER